jgi:hypothetical protein
MACQTTVEQPLSCRCVSPVMYLTGHRQAESASSRSSTPVLNFVSYVDLHLEACVEPLQLAAVELPVNVLTLGWLHSLVWKCWLPCCCICTKTEASTAIHNSSRGCRCIPAS